MFSNVFQSQPINKYVCTWNGTKGKIQIFILKWRWNVISIQEKSEIELILTHVVKHVTSGCCAPVLCHVNFAAFDRFQSCKWFFSHPIFESNVGVQGNTYLRKFFPIVIFTSFNLNILYLVNCYCNVIGMVWKIFSLKYFFRVSDLLMIILIVTYKYVPCLKTSLFLKH